MTGFLQTLIEAGKNMSPWELAAVVGAITYLLLAVKENVWCWLFAFISTAIFTVLFWDVSLLMNSALNVYYMLMAVYGWYQWTHAGSGADQQMLAVSSMTQRQHVLMISAIVILSAVTGYLLGEHTTDAWPYVDAFTTWASVITTYLVTRKYLENWLYWVVIDMLSVPLYGNRGLILTALLFVAYVVIALVGYRSWRRHYHENRQAVAL